ncbi:MAG: glutamate synthase [Oscillospiraceae bacterium]|jgi:glutamate synthase domain-containing protein 3|nr:glutamate synthase [Oscillospiraceae bacterium]
MSYEINGAGVHYKEVNERIKATGDSDIFIKNACGHRYLGAGTSGKNITIDGIPGNALGAYLNGSRIVVNGNAQDAVADTMNSGEIVIHGNCGDTTGYGMRSGNVFIKGNVGYRVGIHMKEYREHRPVIVIGGKAGDFLGEYQAGGIILLLGLDTPSDVSPVGGFPATGMHGGKIFIRSEAKFEGLPSQIVLSDATDADKELFAPFVRKYTEYFGGNADEILSSHFYTLTPNSSNPYKQFYCQN